MAAGGARKGAGRKPGIANAVNKEARAKALETGESPLDYMLRIMRSTGDDKRRDVMAIAAAPYVHSKFASVEHSGPDGGPIKTEASLDMTGMNADQLRALASIKVPAG